VPFILSALVIAALILLHEFGHYLVARLCGMRVNRFSIGFGPPILNFRPRGSETTFQVGALPLGGFVQIAGMDPHEALEPNDTGSYAGKPLWQRAAVVVAGPGANYLVAAVLYAWLYGIGFPKPEAGTIIGDVAVGAPAARAGLRPGDRVLAINGHHVSLWKQVAYSTQRSPHQSLIFQVRRDDRTLEIRVKRRRDHRTHLGFVGISPKVRLDRRSPLDCIPAGAAEAAGDALKLLGALGHSASNLVGPVGILVYAKGQMKQGIRAVLQLASGLSVALCVMNFLPLPALDGGRLIFLGYEVATRRRVPARFEAIVHWVGMVLLLGLLIVVTFRDILAASS
jgi:regulator of sigma E protease